MYFHLILYIFNTHIYVNIVYLFIQITVFILKEWSSWISRLLDEIRRHSTLIIIGETGSGKTTQIPQLLLQAGVAGSSGCIGITQPRRIAAVSIARRVAQEQGVKPGKLVGYCVRFENCASSQTRIKYLTDGMMVREAMTDEILSDYSVYYRYIIITLAVLSSHWRSKIILKLIMNYEDLNNKLGLRFEKYHYNK